MDSPASLAHKLWDEIFKSIVRHMPEQLLPLFKHVFQKEYPSNTCIELLSTEYSALQKSSPKELSSIFADIALRIAQKDIYHIECQMEKDDAISIRIPLSCILETIKLFQIKAPAVYIFRMAQKLFTLFP